MTASKPVYDLARERRIDSVDGVLTIPPRTVVVSGTRRLATAFASQHGLAADVALIVKYRDPSTDARVELEHSLREARDLG